MPLALDKLARLQIYYSWLLFIVYVSKKGARVEANTTAD